MSSHLRASAKPWTPDATTATTSGIAGLFDAEAHASSGAAAMSAYAGMPPHALPPTPPQLLQQQHAAALARLRDAPTIASAAYMPPTDELPLYATVPPMNAYDASRLPLPLTLTPSQQQQQQQQQQPKMSPTAAKLFVGQLPFECTEERLRAFFSAYGHVEHIHILRDNNNRSRGAAFVTFRTVQEADTAIFTLHNRHRMLSTRAIQVSYAKNSPNISPFGTYSALAVHQSNPTNPLPHVATLGAAAAHTF